MFGGFKGSFLDNFLVNKINAIIQNLNQHVSSNATVSDTGHVKLANQGSVEEPGTYALDAIQANCRVQGTLARQILDIKSVLMPVGYIFTWEPISGNATDLSTPQKVHDHYGFGTWELIKDRFLIGAGGSYGIGSAGGETAHTLSASEMPSHTHNYSGNTGGNNVDHVHGGSTGTVSVDHVHGGSTSVAGNHFHDFGVDITPGTNGNTIAFYGVNGTLCNGVSNYKTYINTYAGGEHAHSLSTGGISVNHVHGFTTGGQNTGHVHDYSGTTSTSGSGVAHNNMPPYKAVYIWKRIV